MGYTRICNGVVISEMSCVSLLWGGEVDGITLPSADDTERHYVLS